MKKVLFGAAILVVALVGGLFFLSTPKADMLYNPSEKATITASTTVPTSALGNGVNALGYDVLLQSNLSKNICISPLSISYAMGIATNGAAGETKQQMEKTLHLEGDYNNQIAVLTQQLQNSTSKNVNLHLANSMWVQQNMQVKDTFIAANKFYQTGLGKVDFSKSTDTIKTINNWVSTKTNGKIDDIIKKLSASTKMVIVNAIYFDGKFSDKFTSSSTEKFHGTKKDTEVEMMHKTEQLNYFEKDGMQIVEVPFDNVFTLNIYLPQEGETVSAGIEKIANLKELPSEMKSSSVALSLPEFKLEYVVNLVETMRNLGMTDAFNEKADFSAITSDVDLYIESVIHKTTFEVNKDGVEATAATAVIMGEMSAQIEASNPIEMNCNRPFVYTIHHQPTNTDLFIGVFVQPE